MRIAMATAGPPGLTTRRCEIFPRQRAAGPQRLLEDAAILQADQTHRTERYGGFTPCS